MTISGEVTPLEEGQATVAGQEREGTYDFIGPYSGYQHIWFLGIDEEVEESRVAAPCLGGVWSLEFGEVVRDRGLGLWASREVVGVCQRTDI